MKTPNQEHAVADKRMLELERAFEAAIAAKIPQSSAIFTQIHDIVESAGHRGLSDKAIIEIINATYGLKLHPASFRELRTKARAKLAEGQGLCCARCGQQVPIKSVKGSQISDAAPGNQVASALRPEAALGTEAQA